MSHLKRHYHLFLTRAVLVLVAVLLGPLSAIAQTAD